MRKVDHLAVDPNAPAPGLASNAATILRACAISASDGA
jgi:hypothetical protein